MPIYEYVCKDCGYRFDTLRSICDADKPIFCTKCNSLETKRALSVFNAHSSGKVIAGSNHGGCFGCTGGTCSTCDN